jgi:AAA15 family ATPase/GTPase
MVNAPRGWLLVDEIENGIHYSIQPQLWEFIVQLSNRLNVQVFATTHNWDCITAFQQATRGHESEGMLIRLQWRNGLVQAVEFTEAELAIATRQSIEVR